MKATRDTAVVVKIELTEEEARWLIDVVRNPMYDEDVEKESPENEAMRKTFFYGLNTALNSER